MNRFPMEASLAYKFFQQHLFEPLEGHEGDKWYHLEKLALMYGKVVPYILLLGLIYLYKKINRFSLKISIIVMPVIVYVFFAFVKTKVPSHVFFTCLIIFLALATLILEFFERIKTNFKSAKIYSLIEFIFLFLIGFFNLNTEELQAKHTTWNINKQHIEMLSHNKDIFLGLKDHLPEGTVLFNVKGRHYIEAMFYTDYSAYNFIPSQEQYNDLKRKNRPIAIFKTNEIPGYLKNDSTIIVIDKELQGYD